MKSVSRNSVFRDQELNWQVALRAYFLIQALSIITCIYIFILFIFGGAGSSLLHRLLSSCSERAALVAAHRFLITGPSRAAGHGLKGTRAQ